MIASMSRASSRQGGRAARRGRRRRASEESERDERAVLVVENSAAVAQMVSLYIAERCGRASVVARSLAQAREALASRSHTEWLAAVVNLELADAADGEDIVALMESRQLPTVVLTGTFSEDKRQRILRHDIVDYCLKGKAGIEALVKVIDRLQRNPNIEVLLVDDVAESRSQQLRLLHAQRFAVREAINADQALALYREHPSIAMVLVQLRNPSQAVRLVSDLRELASADDLAIVGLATPGGEALAVQFLKAGASDYLVHPCEREEYACRIYGALDRVEGIRKIKQLAFVDSLTGCANRLAFFRDVPERLADALGSKVKPAVALLAIDQLRRINELHGHSAGDAVLQRVARVLSTSLGPNAYVARFAGEQFCAFVHDQSSDSLTGLLERARSGIERANFSYENKRLNVSLSVGAALCEADDSLDAYVNRADEALGEAEDAGGNRVVIKP
jgi:diguanylate cyclase (GGDEF)-like protein